MNILLVLIPVTLLIMLVAVAIFFWAVNHQQFDDLESPGILPLLDDLDPDNSNPDVPDAQQAISAAADAAPSRMESRHEAGKPPPR